MLNTDGGSTRQFLGTVAIALRSHHVRRAISLRIAVALSNPPGLYLRVADRIVEAIILETFVEIDVLGCTRNSVRLHCLLLFLSHHDPPWTHVFRRLR